MTRTAKLPDGRTLQFPDGTPDSVIQAKVKELVTGQAAPAARPGVDPGGPGVSRTPEERQALIAELEAEQRQFAGGGDPRGAAVAIGSQALAEPISGLAGLVGAVGGLVPGGESPLEKAARFQAGTQEAISIDPESLDPASQRVLEGIGVGAESLTEAVRLPVAGLAGVAQLPFGGVEGAAETVRRTREEGIGPTAGAFAERLGAPPIVSAAIETLPVAAATIAGTRFPKATPKGPQASTLSVAAPDGPQVTVGRPRLDDPVDFTPRKAPLERVAEAPAAGAGAALGARPRARPADAPPPAVPEPPPAPSAADVVEDLSKQRTERLAQAVVPDQAVVDSAQRLGVDLNVEHYATSTAFQDVARALKSRPGSDLLAGEVQAIRDLATRADELVTDIGGALDKGAVSENILSDIRTTIDDLQTQANTAYTQVREAIPAQTRVETGGIRDFIQGRLDDLGGDKTLLSGVERKLLNLVERGEDGTITYAALDRVRRDVGEGFNQRTGPFADNSQRVLREVYDNLSQTQNGVAEAFGVGELYTGARELVARRKGIEDQAVNLFGRDAAGSLVPKIRAAATGLPKGDVTAFNRLLDALPPARRGEVAATVLSELFAAGSRQGGQLGTGFATTWRNLNRNKVARDRLLRELPPEARQRFDDIGRVINAISLSNAKPLANPSGTAAGVIRALENGTLGTRLFDSAKGVAGEAAQTVPVLGSVLRMSKRGDSTPTTDRVKAADSFLTSQTFKDAVQVALEGDLATANRIAENSPQFRRWIETVPEATAQNIGTLGFISWLSSEEE